MYLSSLTPNDDPLGLGLSSSAYLSKVFASFRNDDFWIWLISNSFARSTFNLKCLHTKPVLLLCEGWMGLI